MHYYQFNIGDYASHTSRLTPLEDLAYRRMLDLYYLNEQPLNGCIADVAREIGLCEHVKAVEYILSKFFIEKENGFSQKRIDLEIKKYKSNAKNKSKAGIASAKARQLKASNKVTDVERVLNTTSTGEQLNINHKPITNNQEPAIKDIVVITPKFNFKKELLLMDVDKDVLTDWLIVRKDKKASNTKTALTKIVNQILKTNLTVAEAIKFSCENGWKGFEAEWYFNKIGTARVNSKTSGNLSACEDFING